MFNDDDQSGEPASFKSLEEAMQALKSNGFDVVIPVENAPQPDVKWVRPIEAASKRERADEARRQAQRLMEIVTRPID
jgi:hypothetical protein